MNRLTPIRLESAAALAAVVAESLDGIEPGLARIERSFVAGETLVDVVAIDDDRRLVTVVVELEADAGAVARGLEAATWCREHAPLLARVFPDAVVEPAAPARIVLVAARVPERVRRLLRALGPVAPAAVECRVFEFRGERCVAYERVGESPDRPGEGRGEAPDLAAPAPVAVANLSPPTSAERAQSLIERLEALRFGPAFRS